MELGEETLNKHPIYTHTHTHSSIISRLQLQRPAGQYNMHGRWEDDDDDDVIKKNALPFGKLFLYYYTPRPEKHSAGVVVKR